jgi:hypothetical protein
VISRRFYVDTDLSEDMFPFLVLNELRPDSRRIVAGEEMVAPCSSETSALRYESTG